MGCDLFPTGEAPLTDNSSPKENSDSKQVITEENGLRIVLKADKSVYSPGEPVKLLFKVQNIGNQNKEFIFSSGQLYEFIVMRNRSEIWRWSQGKFFIQAFSHRSIGPGESLCYQTQWDQVNSDGETVSGGIYEIKAIMTAREEIESGVLIIRIK